MRRRNRQCKRFAAKPVHDNIYWQPTQGSVQGAQDTLDKKAGNAMDTASLLIALLRASGIPARYVYGSVEVPADQMMNWVGGAGYAALTETPPPT
jgi:transglutaminase-like putative cysteine protease